MTHRRKPGAKAREDVRLRFTIKAYSPKTIPLERLAAYLKEYAAVLGETSAVHFDSLEEGSTVAVARVEHEAAPKVRARLDASNAPNTPSDIADPIRRINELLRLDNAVGYLREGKRRSNILYFPGVEQKLPPTVRVEQPGSIQGVVMRVGGKDQSIPIHLEVEGEEVKGCHAARAVAKQLAGHLFDHVRLFGVGTWERDPHGVWSMQKFRVTHFEQLKESSLGDVVSELQRLNVRIGDLEEGAG